jgi:hypothetical protein
MLSLFANLSAQSAGVKRRRGLWRKAAICQNTDGAEVPMSDRSVPEDDRHLVAGGVGCAGIEPAALSGGKFRVSLTLSIHGDFL